MTRYQPVGTEDFDDIRCDLDEEKTQESEIEEEREASDGISNFVAKLTAISIAGGLGLAGIHGLITGDWKPLGTVWAFTAVPVGAALTVVTKQCG